MRKRILFIIVLLLAFTSTVNADEIYHKDIPEDAVIIGTHLFSSEYDYTNSGVYNGSITSQVVMMGSSSLNTSKYSSASDFIIYRKVFDEDPDDPDTYPEEWINSLTGNDISLSQIPEYFTINYINGTCVVDDGCELLGNNEAVFKSYGTDIGDITTSVYYAEGHIVNPPAAPSKAGYEFVCWTLEDDNDIDDRDCYEFTGATPLNSIFEAKYEAITYTITYDLNGGNGAAPKDSICTIDVANSGNSFGESDSCIFRETASTKLGYDFVGWGLQKDSDELYYKAGDSIINSLGENNVVTLYAIWKPAVYTISYDRNGGVDNNPDSYEYNPDGTTIALVPSVKENYDFVSWTLEDDTNAKLDGLTLTLTGTGNVKLIASYTEKQVVFVDDANGNTITTCKYLDPSCTLPDADVSEGYQFGGWRVVDSDIVLNSSFDHHIFTNSEVRVTKVEEPIVYTITYDLDGGNGGTYKTSYTVVDKKNNTDLGLSTKPVKDGYTFDKWLLGNNEFNWNNVSGNITIKAKYNANSIKVIFKDGDNTTDKNCTYGESCKIEVDDPTLDNSEFAGWLHNGILYHKDDDVKDAIGTKEDVVFTSQFSHKNDYAIHYDLDATDAYLSGNAISQIAPDSESITLADPYRRGYKFNGWALEKADGSKEVVKSITGANAITKDDEKAVFLTATWEPIKFTFEFAETELESKVCTYDVDCKLDDHSDLQPLSGDADYIYEFTGWTTSDGKVTYANNYDVTNMYDIETTITLKPVFKEISHRIIYYYNEADNAGDTVQYYIPGDKVTFPEDPTREGYTFIGWVGLDGNAITPEDVSDISDEDVVVVIAKFRLITYYGVKFVNGYDGTEIPSQECNHYDNCTIVPPENPTREGYRFTGWSNPDYSLDVPLNITDVKIREVVFTANWSDKLTVEFVDGEEKECTYNQPCDYSSYKLENTDDKKFVGWENTEGYDVSNIPTTDTSISKITFTAKWNTQYTVKFYDGTDTKYEKTCTYNQTCDLSSDVENLPNKDTGIFKEWKNDNYSIDNINVKATEDDNIIFMAVWETSYPIELVDGENIQNLTGTYGEEFDLTSYALDNKEGVAKFVGWKYGEEVVTKVPALTTETTKVTLNAVWNDKYTVSFKDGEETIGEPFECTYGECPITVSDPTKDNAKFIGWFNGEEKFNGTVNNSDLDIDTITYVAQWSYTYKVDFVNGETSFYKKEDCHFGESCTITIPGTPEKDGYRFLGWKNGENIFDGTVTNEDKADVITYTADWTDKYTVSFKDGEETIGEPLECTYKVSCPLDKTLTNTDTKRFDGWVFNDAVESSITFNDFTKSSITVTAKWTNLINVIFYDDNGTTELDKISCVVGEICDLSSMKSSTKAGYRFTGWTPLGDAPAYQESLDIASDATGSIEYKGSWTNNYTVKFVSRYNSDGETNPINERSVTCTYSAEEGQCDLSGIVPGTRSGYRFTGWTNEDASGKVYEETFSLNDTSIAEVVFVSNWTDEYTIEFYQGTTKLGDSITAKYGQSQDLSEIHADSADSEGNPFRGWTSNVVSVSYTDNFVLTDTSVSVIKFTAIYAAYDEYTISFHSNDGTIDLYEDDTVTYGHDFIRSHWENGDISLDGTDVKYYIAGWATSANSDDIVYPFNQNFGDVKSPNETLDLYAVVKTDEEYILVEERICGELSCTGADEIFKIGADISEFDFGDLEYYLDSELQNKADMTKPLTLENWTTIETINDSNRPQLKGKLTLHGKEVD